MARRVSLTTELDCSPDDAWQHVQTTRLLQHIAAPLIRFLPVARQEFPEIWTEGEYRAWMFLFGVIPLGWQAIVITLPEPEGNSRFVRDNGYSLLIRRWDHWITIEPAGDGTRTRYTDTVHVDAGLLTPLIAGFAKVFYAHRQRRWRALARRDFSALALTRPLR
ncbi:hypothetical protein MACH24_04380 [Erythrobacter sp. Dej080120_24]|uniref:hypothetical protein n=1 Tax=Erythrobacter sp. Dej080120_24 TaxID=3024837 RepID=UPI002926B3CD|nr:hypothetical protein MACH24_04380 [Erythrobacter sp. Dej080120_24]